MVKFKNRIDAAEKLTTLLEKFKGTDTVIFGIPRGGMVIANVIAKKLLLPLEMVVVRKIGHPKNPEYAIAAISESGMMVKNEEEVKNVDKAWFDEEAEKQLQEAKRRKIKYSSKRPYLRYEGKTVILVDDGLATGLTIEAAIKELTLGNPKKIVVAVPVSARDSSRRIKNKVDEFISYLSPTLFDGAVGAYYEDFPQVEDKEIIDIMIKNDPFFLPCRSLGI